MYNLKFYINNQYIKIYKPISDDLVWTIWVNNKEITDVNKGLPNGTPDIDSVACLLINLKESYLKSRIKNFKYN